MFLRGLGQIAQALKVGNEFTLYSPGQTVILFFDGLGRKVFGPGNQTSGDGFYIYIVNQLGQILAVGVLIPSNRPLANSENLGYLVLGIAFQTQVGHADAAFIGVDVRGLQLTLSQTLENIYGTASGALGRIGLLRQGSPRSDPCRLGLP